MTEAVAEVADGFFFHPFTTSTYLRQVTLPALQRGRATAGFDSLDGFTVAGPAFVCAGRDEAELAAAVEGTKRQIAFYGSTPAYRSVLELHGWGDASIELNRLARRGRWSEMGELIDDELLAAFSAVGSPAEVGRQLAERWDGVADRITLYLNYATDAQLRREIVEAVRTQLAPSD
jgi:probable F420-dependent oxidoreductase